MVVAWSPSLIGDLRSKVLCMTMVRYSQRAGYNNTCSVSIPKDYNDTFQYTFSQILTTNPVSIVSVFERWSFALSGLQKCGSFKAGLLSCVKVWVNVIQLSTCQIFFTLISLLNFFFFNFLSINSEVLYVTMVSYSTELQWCLQCTLFQITASIFLCECMAVWRVNPYMA